jgi:hypothetical protein
MGSCKYSSNKLQHSVKGWLFLDQWGNYQLLKMMCVSWSWYWQAQILVTMKDQTAIPKSVFLTSSMWTYLITNLWSLIINSVLGWVKTSENIRNTSHGFNQMKLNFIFLCGLFLNIYPHHVSVTPDVVHVHVNGVRLCLRTAVTHGPIVHPPNDNEYGQPWWKYIDRRKQRTLRRACSSATLSTTNATRTEPDMNPGLCGERPVTNHLSHGMAIPPDNVFKFDCF